MTVDVGLILGTGFGAQVEGIGGAPLFVPTPRGTTRGTLISHEGVRILIVRRHAAAHRVPPHAVPYASMALALKQLAVQGCIATAAVGSLREDWGPGTFAACSGFLDVSSRNLTIFPDQVVHTDFTHPFASRPIAALTGAAAEARVPVQDGAIYVNANGPRYETPQEIAAYRRAGGDIVGMTAGSEAVLMREAGVPYGCLAIVTNMAAGMATQPLSHGEVEDAMRSNSEIAWNLLLAAAKRLATK